MSKWAPYQILFPIGILSSLMAVGVWLIESLNWFSSPAFFIHSKLVAGGFLWSFIVGFLMTAIPRMTGAKNAHPIELWTAISLISAGIFFSFFVDARWFYSNQIITVLFLIFFGAKRVMVSQKAIPVFFSHVGLAMISAIVGAYFYFSGNNLMGLHLFHVGAVLLLILGIGTRFFSFLSGLPSEFENASKIHHMVFHTLGFLVVFFLYMAGSKYTWAYLGLTLTSLLYLVYVWRIFRSSNRPSALKHGVRTVALMMPLSFLLCWMRPELYITWLHFIFIGCFGLLTYAVATRVTLAHGSYSIGLEVKSVSLWLFLGLLILALIARIFYGVTDGPWKMSSLYVAATFWLAAILTWCCSFAVKIIRQGDQQKPTC